jgi:hypothetical protein
MATSGFFKSISTSLNSVSFILVLLNLHFFELYKVLVVPTI